MRKTMFRTSAICSALLLIGCDGGAGADGYRFDRAEFERSQVTVTVVTHGGSAELRQAAAQMGVRAEGRRLMAFGLVDAARPACTIHIVDPARGYRPEWIGHELTHCIRGRWHD